MKAKHLSVLNVLFAARLPYHAVGSNEVPAMGYKEIARLSCKVDSHILRDVVKELHDRNMLTRVFKKNKHLYYISDETFDEFLYEYKKSCTLTWRQERMEIRPVREYGMVKNG